MGDFETKYKNYQKSNPSFLQFNYNKPKDVGFIKNAILSIFDRKDNKGKRLDGIIDEKEFRSLTRAQYKQYVKEIKLYYKKENNRDLAYHIPTYDELSSMLDTDKFKTFSFFNTKTIIASEIEEPIIPDGKIGQTNQQGSGDCYQNATDIALSVSNKGRALLQKSIQRASDGSYFVTLYGAQKSSKTGKYVPVNQTDNTKQVPITYRITQLELKKAQETLLPNGNKKYPSGDADMVLLDMAVERYRRSTQATPQYAKNRKNVKGYDDYLSTGNSAVNIQLITGKKGYIQTFKQRYDETARSTDGKMNTKIKYKHIHDENNVIKNLKLLERSPEKIVLNCTFVSNGDWKNFKQKYKLYEAHAYAVASYNSKTGVVTVIDPHNGKNRPTNIPIADFKKFLAQVQFAAL